MEIKKPVWIDSKILKWIDSKILKVANAEVLAFDALRMAMGKLRHGHWIVPKIPTKYKRIRVSCDDETCSHPRPQLFHYEKVAIRWRRGKRKWIPAGSPMYMITSEETFSDIKKLLKQELK